MIHTINLNGYSATTDGGKPITLGTAGSYGIETLKIITDDTWAGLAITATFVTATGAVKMLVNPDGTCTVPPEATANPTNVIQSYIVFAGVADGVQRISCDLPYRVRDHVPIDGVASKPTPNEWQQYIAETQKIINKAVPQEGNVGQVLTKTADGSDWADPKGVQIDDASITTTKTWSSKEIVDRLAPPFRQKGPIVQGELVADYPMQVKSYIEPIQEGTGDPSPENVRPIHGIHEIQMTKCGKNLLKMPDREVYPGTFNPSDSIKLNGATLFPGFASSGYYWGTISEYNISAGEMTFKQTSDWYGMAFDLIVRPNVQMSVSWKSVSRIDLRATFYNAQGILISSAYSNVFTTPENAAFVVISFVAREDYLAGASTSVRDIQVETSTTSTPYEPYHGETYTQTLPEEVLGGVYEWDTGVFHKSIQAVRDTAFQRSNTLPGKNWASAYFSNGSRKPTKTWCDSAIVTDWLSLATRDTIDKIYCWYATGSSGVAVPYSLLGISEGATTEQIVSAITAYMGDFMIVQDEFTDTIQLPKHLILSNPNITTIYGNTAEVEVIARKDPNAEYTALRNAILTLGGKI